MKYVVQEDAYVYASTKPSLVPLLAVETPAWYAWVEEVAQFTFHSQYGAFSARKERVSNGRGGSYWRAYRKKQGKLYRVYLGKSNQLTMARLKSVAQELAQRLEQGDDKCNSWVTEKNEKSAVPAALNVNKSHKIVHDRTTYHLLHTKLHIPVFQAHLVARARLVQRLNVGLRRRLILLSAAAGSGKTTSLSEWACQSSALIAWVALDKEDNDPARFWSYILAALQRASLEKITPLLEMVRSQPPVSLIPTVRELLNILGEEGNETVIILDDYHLIEAQVIHDSLVFFLDHLPKHVHLVLASRHELPFSIASLRAKRHLVELHSADLSFTSAEAEVFFAQTEHLALAKADIEMLMERTEGWITGLQLAALSLYSLQDTAQFISSFKGSHRFILSYLVDEVLERQPEHVQRFLLATSVLERFTASLCDTLTGEKNGTTMLAYLEQKNLFLFPLDNEGRWYRYHHLLTEALSTRVRQEQPEYFGTLHRLASAWYEQHNLLEDAIRHALAATDFVRAADLLERLVDTMLKQNEFASVTLWKELLPTDLLTERPWLCQALVRLYIASGRLDQAEEILRDLEHVGIEKIASNTVDAFRGRIAALYAHLYSSRGEAQKSLAYVFEALALLPEDDLEWRTSVRAAMGGAYLHAGNLVEAEQVLREVVHPDLQRYDPYRALTALHLLGQTQVLLGRPGLANATYRQGIQLATHHGLMHSAVMGHIHAGCGNLLYEWNDLEGAQNHLVAGLELARRGGNSIQALDCTLTLADVRLAQGRMQDSHMLLQQAQELAHQTNDPFFLDFVTRRPVVLWLAAHDIDAAVRCAHATGLYFYGEVDTIASLPSTYFLLIELLVLIRLYLAQGNLPGAKRLLAQLQSPLMNGPNKRRCIQWLILHALALYAEEHVPEATGELALALELAEPLGYNRTFIDMGEALLPLLKILRNLKPLANYSPNYIRQLLAMLDKQDMAEKPAENSASTELLSEHEFVILRCLAEGYTDREIARHLVRAENTVKTHTKHIYDKLNVHSRTQAIARARELGLL
ncbi:LuxR C-terminal-related transcriptional regulator [Ktedonobacter robiniae]|uniref:HTH luxR-type domain-containing protein n=1 Tax=Ktedonobacter robiniae TaxID=2778365 RepID=A0ABQ3V439_9CHLR|nr:LuxR C-terminal-related transcriptional regulator [Ktedonobacter robiniae]GHO59929.1 hypothetical protein KSB_84040 [Ktedonobacter robiniae]